MNCDQCQKECKQATQGPGTEGQWWCDQCCRDHGVRLLVVPVAEGEALRLRRLEEREAKAQARLDHLKEHGCWPQGGAK